MFKRRNYQNKELTTVKVQVVYYERMKRIYRPITFVCNVQTRRATHTGGYQTPPVPDFDHSRCREIFSPLNFAPQLTSPAPVSRPSSLPSPSPAPVMDVFSNRTSSSAHLLSPHQYSKVDRPFP